MTIALTPIGTVHSSRTEPSDDEWDSVTASIELDASFEAEALDGLEAFSHAEVIFCFDRIPEWTIERGARHPRNNPAWPRVGIFAQRASARPNRLGATIVRVLGRDGRVLRVSGLDAIEGTPVLDIKPVMQEFLPRDAVHQPAWCAELMRNYWRRV